MNGRLDFSDIEDSILKDDLEYDFFLLVKELSKTDFLFPDSSNIIKYDGETYYYHNDENLPVNTGNLNVSILNINNNAVNIKLTGTVSTISNAVKTEAGLTNSTNAALFLIEMPQLKYNTIKVNGTTINVNDLYGDVETGHLYFVWLVGVYNNGGVIAENGTLQIDWENYSRTYSVNVSELNL